MVLWKAKQATINIGNPIATLSSSATIDSQMSGAVDWSGVVKGIEIGGAEADVDSVFLFGSTNGAQNAETDEENMSMREFTGTLIFTDRAAMALATGAGTSVGSTGYTRVSGDTTRSKKAISIEFTDGTNHVTCLLNNALFTKLGDISLDAEGHAEQEITAKCLAKDYHEEDDF